MRPKSNGKSLRFAADGDAEAEELASARRARLSATRSALSAPAAATSPPGRSARASMEVADNTSKDLPLPNGQQPPAAKTDSNCRRYCCCCLVAPKWMQCIIVYLIPIPFVYVITHFTMYPGTLFSGPPQLPRNCREFVVNSDGYRIPAVRCNHGDTGLSSKSVPIVVFGGNGMNMYNAVKDMDVILRRVPRQVFSVSLPGFQYNARGSLGSWLGSFPKLLLGDWLRVGWTSKEVALADARALLKHVFRETGRPSVIFGWSLGSSLAARLAAVSEGDMVQCVVLGNPFPSSRRLVATSWTGYLLWPYWYLVDKWATSDWVSGMRAPTIVMSNLDDERVPPLMHDEVFHASGARDKVEIRARGGHMNISAFRSMEEKGIGQDLLKWCVASGARPSKFSFAAPAPVTPARTPATTPRAYSLASGSDIGDD